MHQIASSPPYDDNTGPSFHQQSSSSSSLQQRHHHHQHRQNQYLASQQQQRQHQYDASFASSPDISRIAPDVELDSGNHGIHQNHHQFSNHSLSFDLSSYSRKHHGNSSNIGDSFDALQYTRDRSSSVRSDGAIASNPPHHFPQEDTSMEDEYNASPGSPYMGRPPQRRRSSVDLAFITEFSKALLQMESTLDTEDSIEGSQHRVRRLFQFHENLHSKHDIELIERSEDSLNEVRLNDVHVPDEKELSETEKILRNESKQKVDRVLELSEKFQKLYKSYETELNSKAAMESEMDKTVEELKEKLHNLEYQLYEKDQKLQGEVDNLHSLKEKTSQLERMYRKERKRKETLLKGVGLVPEDAKSKKKRRDSASSDEDDTSDQKKKSRKRKRQKGSDSSDSSSESSDDSSSIDSSDDDRSVKEKTEEAMKSIVTPESENENKKADAVQESYVRFVDGFSHRLEAYEAEKLLTQQQIDELKILVREKDEAMGEHMKKLERVVALKDQQLIQEREKFRKMFLHQLTREDESVARLKAKISADSQNQLSARKEMRKKSWADHRKSKLVRKKSSARLKRMHSTTSVNSTPMSPISDVDEDLSSYRFGDARSRRNSVRPAGLDTFLEAAEKKMKEQEANSQQKNLEKQMLQDSKAARRKELVEKKNKKLRKAYKKMQRKVEDIQKRLEIYDAASKPIEGERPYGDEGPYGRVVLVFTDIQGSTNLWERSIDDMVKSIEIHNDIVRNTLKDTGGYEVKTEGDAFMCAFSNSFDAIEFAMLCQMRLLEGEWPEGVYDAPEGKIEHDIDGNVVWRGIRVRMGMHVGEPLVMKDPTTGREDYFGPVVNKSARIEGCAQGGEVCVSDDVWKDVESIFHDEDKKKRWTYPPFIRTVISASLKGISGKETVRSLLPAQLQNRNFAPVQPKKEAASDDVFNTVKKLRKQVDDLVKESQTMKHLMESNDYKQELEEKEEMIEFLSMELLAQERDMKELEDAKDSEIHLLKEELKNQQKATDQEAKRLQKLKEKEAKKKYQINITDIKQLNHHLKFMTRQRDTFQKKNKDLHYSLIEANDKIARLKQSIRRLKMDLNMQKKKSKKNNRHSASHQTDIHADRPLPRIRSKKSVSNTSAPNISVAAPDEDESDNKESTYPKAEKTPRYMKHLTRRVKSNVRSWVNPLWQTADESPQEEQQQSAPPPQPEKRMPERTASLRLRRGGRNRMF